MYCPRMMLVCCTRRTSKPTTPLVYKDVRSLTSIDGLRLTYPSTFYLNSSFLHILYYPGISDRLCLQSSIFFMGHHPGSWASGSQVLTEQRRRGESLDSVCTATFFRNRVTDIFFVQSQSSALKKKYLPAKPLNSYLMLAAVCLKLSLARPSRQSFLHRKLLIS